ncbi:MAG TPA: flagellar export chaperone FliS [Syntrophus sp. (in: bacteria)]|nr:flagellar export chaperone FliS [Syntrophus sp. (in: bacteria)]
MYEAVTRSYQEANFLSADPIKLVRMCYEGAISSLKLARESYIASDYEAKGRALLKAFDIIHELNVSLDMEKGGEVAKNLRALYLYMTQSLTDADLKRDMTVFDDVIRMLEELESAWQELALGKPVMASLSPALIPNETNNAAMVSRMAWSA